MTSILRCFLSPYVCIFVVRYLLTGGAYFIDGSLALVHRRSAAFWASSVPWVGVWYPFVVSCAPVLILECMPGLSKRLGACVLPWAPLRGSSASCLHGLHVLFSRHLALHDVRGAATVGHQGYESWLYSVQAMWQCMVSMGPWFLLLRCVLLLLCCVSSTCAGLALHLRFTMWAVHTGHRQTGAHLHGVNKSLSVLQHACK